MSYCFQDIRYKTLKKAGWKKIRIKDRFNEWGMKNVKIVIIIIYFKFYYNYWELLVFFKLIKKCLCEFKVQFNPRMSRFLKQFLSKYFIFRIIGDLMHGPEMVLKIRFRKIGILRDHYSKQLFSSTFFVIRFLKSVWFIV